MACLLSMPHKLSLIISISLSIRIVGVESMSTSINFTCFLPLIAGVYIYTHIWRVRKTEWSRNSLLKVYKPVLRHWIHASQSKQFKFNNYDTFLSASYHAYEHTLVLGLLLIWRSKKTIQLSFIELIIMENEMSSASTGYLWPFSSPATQCTKLFMTFFNYNNS
jgi:hypothetical protein